MNLTTIFAYFPLIADHLWAQFLLIIAFYAFLAAITDLFVDGVLKRLATLTNNKADDEILALIHAPLYKTILLIGFIHALSLYSTSTSWNIAIRLGKSVILLTWLLMLLRVLAIIARQTTGKWQQKLGRDLLNLGHKLAIIIICLSGAYWLLSIWQINLTPLLASAGIAGIAIAMAAKDTLANFFGGLSLFADAAFKVGDYIIIDNNVRGEVVELGIRSTKVLTRDDILVNVPNSILATSMIINESAPNPLYRIKVPVGVAYGSDLAAVERILVDIGSTHPDIVPQPSPRVRLRSLGDSALNFDLLVWVKDPRDRGKQTHEILKKIYNELTKEGISIPFPQRDIHLINPTQNNL